MYRPGAIFLVLSGLILGAQAHAQTYKVIGTDGRVTYTDRPPAESSSSSRVSEVRLPTLSTPVDTSAVAQPLRDTASFSPAEDRRGGVVMYSTEWCGYCAKARRYMSSQGIRYKEVDIEKDADGRAEHARLGGRGVPFFVAGSSTLAGYSESGIDRLARNRR